MTGKWQVAHIEDSINSPIISAN